MFFYFVKKLLVAYLNLVDINTTAQPVNGLRSEIAGCLNAATHLSLQVDDYPLPARDLLQSRVRSIPFAAVLPANEAPTGPPAPAGIYSPAINDGYYVMLEPLSVGAHTCISPELLPDAITLLPLSM